MYVVKGGIESDATFQLADFETALLLETRVVDIERGACWGVADGIDAETDIREGDVVIVKACHLGFEAVVITQPALVPSETAHLVDTLPQVDVGILGDGMSHIGIHVEGVARHVEGQTALVDAEAVGVDNPFRFRRRGVHRCCVRQLDVEVGLRQTGTVHLHRLLVQIDAFRRQPQLLHPAFDAQVAEKTVGVESGLLQREFVDYHTLFQQRP